MVGDEPGEGGGGLGELPPGGQMPGPGDLGQQARRVLRQRGLQMPFRFADPALPLRHERPPKQRGDLLRFVCEAVPEGRIGMLELALGQVAERVAVVRLSFAHRRRGKRRNE